MTPEYLFEWISPPSAAPRILLVGDMFMYEARLALEPIVTEAVDSVAGNTPLAGRLEHLHRILGRREYATVVLGESRHKGEADGCCLPTLRQAYPRTRFLLATAPPPYLLSSRYRTPCPGQHKRHAAVQAMAAAQGLPCLSFDACCRRAGVHHRLAAWLTHARHALQNLAAAQPYPLGRDFTRKLLTHSLLQQLEAHAAIHPTAPHAIPCNRDSSIAWVNRIHQEASPVLCLGDSNMYRFRLAHPWLARHTDLHASTLNLLSGEAEEEIDRALQASHRGVVVSLGVHHLEESTQPDFSGRCMDFLQRLQGDGRRVVVAATTPCMQEDDLSQPDEARNALIQHQNGRLADMAKQCGIPFANLYPIMAQGRHTDPVHFTRRSYRPASALLVRLLKS